MSHDYRRTSEQRRTIVRIPKIARRPGRGFEVLDRSNTTGRRKNRKLEFSDSILESWSKDSPGYPETKTGNIRCGDFIDTIGEIGPGIRDRFR